MDIKGDFLSEGIVLLQFSEQKKKPKRIKINFFNEVLTKIRPLPFFEDSRTGLPEALQYE